MKTLKDRLQLLLQEQNKSAADLARATGKTESAVSQWLSGEVKSMRSDSLIACAVFFSVNPNWLSSGKGQRETAPNQVLSGPGSLSNNPERLDAILGSVAGMFRMIPEDEWAEALMEVAATLQKRRRFR